MLLSEVQQRRARGEKVLVTTLTKRMAEDLDTFFRDSGVRSGYLHSAVKPLARLEVLRNLRASSSNQRKSGGAGGPIDVLVGVNLLREGLNLPEVSLVCILDADKEGFLRSDTALIQTIGRATRNTRWGHVSQSNWISRGPSMRPCSSV